MAKTPEQKLYTREMLGKSPPKRPAVRPTTPAGKLYGLEFQQRGR